MDILTQGSSVVKPEISSDNPTKNMLVATYERGGTKHAMYLAALAIDLRRSPTSFFKTEIRKLTGVSERTADAIVSFFRLLEQEWNSMSPQNSAHGWVPSICTNSSTNSTNHEQVSTDPQLVGIALQGLKSLGWGKRRDGYMCYSDSNIVEYIRENGARDVLYAIQASNEPGIQNRCAIIRTNLRNGLRAPAEWHYSPTPTADTDIAQLQPEVETFSISSSSDRKHSRLPVNIPNSVPRRLVSPETESTKEDRIPLRQKLPPPTQQTTCSTSRDGYAGARKYVPVSDPSDSGTTLRNSCHSHSKEQACEPEPLRGYIDRTVAVESPRSVHVASNAPCEGKFLYASQNTVESLPHEDPHMAAELSTALRRKICDKSYRHWFESVTWLVQEGGKVFCFCGSIVHAEWVSTHYGEVVSSAFSELGIKASEVSYCSSKGLA